MRIQVNPPIPPVNRCLLWSLLVLLFLAGAGCSKLASWRHQQVSTSHKIAQGSKITPPAAPVQVPDDVKSALPVDPSFQVLNYADTSGQVSLELLSTWDTTRTCEWLLTQMQARDYIYEDNPSRILEGLDFIPSETNTGAKFKRIRIKVSLNTADQTTVKIDASIT